MNGKAFAIAWIAATTAIAALAPLAGAQDANWRDGRKVFRACKGCHSFTPGKHLFGPSLAGIYGRKAGTAAAFTYSPGMRAKGAEGLTWTEKTLDVFLTAPAKFVHDTRMRFPGLAERRKRIDLIAYLKRRSRSRR